MRTSHPLPTSPCGDWSPTWGSWGSSITFLSLLSWKLVETCGKQRDATSALQHPSSSCNRGGVPHHPTLLGVPKLPRWCWERDNPLPGKAGSAGWLESLKACGDAKEVAAETAGSSRTSTQRDADDSPMRQPWPGCHRSILHPLQTGRGQPGGPGHHPSAPPSW